MSSFEGFPPELFAFFKGLEEDNSRAYWQANRTVWEDRVRRPMLAMLDELSVEFGPLRMFRPNRDVRFARDKSPYKLWTGATSEAQAVGGMGYYFSLSATTMTIAYGAMVMTGAQAKRFRAAIADARTGGELEQILARSAADGFPVTGGLEPPLQRVPSGFSPTHPRSGLLRWRGVGIIREDARADWMSTRSALDRVRRVWTVSQPLKAWLDRNVGTG